MRADGELRGPVGYDDRWLVLAAFALAVVAVYYAVVLWWGRERPAALPPARRAPQAPCLARIDQIESAVRAGELTPRAGHQQLSAAVRGFVARASGVPATTMTLADLRRDGPDRLADLVALLYPPAFVADDALATDRFDAAVAEARQVVGSWT